jgi:hypothetical protein
LRRCAVLVATARLATVVAEAREPASAHLLLVVVASLAFLFVGWEAGLEKLVLLDDAPDDDAEAPLAARAILVFLARTLALVLEAVKALLAAILDRLARAPGVDGCRATVFVRARFGYPEVLTT